MSTKSLPVINETGTYNITADSEDNANTAAMRDGSGDMKAKTFTATVQLKASAGLNLKSTAKSATFTADGATSSGSVKYVCDTTSGSITVNLPAAASSSGLTFSFVKTIAANSLIIDGNSSETVGGAATKTASAQYAAITIWCDGSAWHIESTIGTWS